MTVHRSARTHGPKPSVSRRRRPRIRGGVAPVRWTLSNCAQEVSDVENSSPYRNRSRCARRERSWSCSALVGGEQMTIQRTIPGARRTLVQRH